MLRVYSIWYQCLVVAFFGSSTLHEIPVDRHGLTQSDQHFRPVGRLTHCGRTNWSSNLAFAGVGLWACKEASGQRRSFWHWRRQKFRCSNWQPLSQRERCVSRGPSLPRVGSWRYKKCRPCYGDLNSTWQVSWEVVVYDTYRMYKAESKSPLHIMTHHETAAQHIMPHSQTHFQRLVLKSLPLKR